MDLSKELEPFLKPHSIERGQRLRAAMSYSKQNNADISISCGVDERTVRRWKNGSRIKVANIYPIAKRCHVSVSYLTHGIVIPAKPFQDEAVNEHLKQRLFLFGY